MSANNEASGPCDEPAPKSEPEAEERSKETNHQVDLEGKRVDLEGKRMRKDDSGIGIEPADDQCEPSSSKAANGGQESPDSGNQDCAEAAAAPERQETPGTAEKRPTTETEDDSDGLPEEKKQKTEERKKRRLLNLLGRTRRSGSASEDTTSADTTRGGGSSSFFTEDSDDHISINSDDTFHMSQDDRDEEDAESVEGNYDPTPSTPAPPYKWLVWRELTQREYGRPTAASHVDQFRVDCYGSRRMLERLELMYKMHAHDGCVNALHFNSAGTRLASGSDDLSVVIWDWATGEPVLKYDSGHRSNVFQAKFVPMTGDCYIVSCARDGLVRLAELSSTGVCKTTRRLAQHRATAHKLAIENDSPHTVLSCGEDAYVFGIDLRKSTPDKLVLVKENDKKVPLYTIFINPTNSNEFAVGGRDHYVRVYDRRFTSEESNAVKKFCPHHLMNCEVRASVSCLVYNYDGSEILASYNDEDIYIFNSHHSDGAEFVHRYKGHRNSQTVKGVNYMGLRSEYVISGSDCGYIYLWDKESEHIIHSMHGDEEGVVNCLEPHPSCPILATSGLDEDVKIWVPSCENPPDMSDLKSRVCKNMKEREEERKREGHEAIDSQMLWYLMQQLHRSAQNRARGDRSGGGDSSTDSDNSDDDDDMDTQHSVQCVQS